MASRSSTPPPLVSGEADAKKEEEIDQTSVMMMEETTETGQVETKAAATAATAATADAEDTDMVMDGDEAFARKLHEEELAKKKAIDAEHKRKFEAGLVEEPDMTAAPDEQGRRPQAAANFMVIHTRADGQCGMSAWALANSIHRRAGYSDASKVPKGEMVLVQDAKVRQPDGSLKDPCGDRMRILIEKVCEWCDPKHYDEQVGGQFVDPKTGKPNMTRKEWMEIYVLAADLTELKNIADYPHFLRKQFKDMSNETRAAGRISQLGWIGSPAMTILSHILHVRVEVWGFGDDHQTLKQLTNYHGFDTATAPENANKIPYRFLLLGHHYVPMFTKRTLEKVVQNSSHPQARSIMFNSTVESLNDYCAKYMNNAMMWRLPSSRTRPRARRRHASGAGAGAGAGAGTAPASPETIAPTSTPMTLAEMASSMSVAAAAGYDATFTPVPVVATSGLDLSKTTNTAKVKALSVLQAALQDDWTCTIIIDPKTGSPQLQVSVPKQTPPSSEVRFDTVVGAFGTAPLCW